MIRIDTGTGWLLVEHGEHARLAGRFAAHWGNEAFAPPEPRADLLVAVSRHDDAWKERDDPPHLTREGRPSGYTKELVGRYSAFEEIDLGDYLSVRGRSTEKVAGDNPYAAVIISMHTVDLLTNQADLSKLGESDRALHGRFVEGQRRRQRELLGGLSAQPQYAASVLPEVLHQGFDFLQACDSLSLTACVRFESPIPLRGRHPTRAGETAVLDCTPLGNDTYRVSPYPFDVDDFEEEARCKFVPPKFGDLADFRATYAAAPYATLRVRIVR